MSFKVAQVNVILCCLLSSLVTIFVEKDDISSSLPVAFSVILILFSSGLVELFSVVLVVLFCALFSVVVLTFVEVLFDS